MAFHKHVEDFVCAQCGSYVVGDGYTNHCSKCLWSKHVDIDPGDRAATCGGIMEPVSVEGSTENGYRIRHRCTICGFERMNRVVPNDSTSAIRALARKRRQV